MNKIIFLCIFIIANYSFSQQAEQKKLQELPIDSSLVWMEMHSPTNTETFLPIGLDILKRGYLENNPAHIAAIHAQLGNWHGYHGLFPQDSVVHHSEKSLHYYRKSGDSLKIGNAYKTLAIDYLNSNSLIKAQEALFKALPIFEHLENDEGMAEVYRILSLIYRVSENPKKSIMYADKAAAIFENLEDDASLAITYFNHIIGYTELEDFKKAYAYADRSISLVSIEVPEEQFIPVRAYSYRGDVSIKANNYKQALTDYTTAWKICESLIGQERASSYRAEIGNTLRLQQKYEEALPHLIAGVEAYENKQSKNSWQPYLYISECYKELDNHEKALYYFEKSTDIKTKMLEDQVTTMETEAVIKYETAEKDETIYQQDAMIAQQQKAQLLYLGIAILLLILLIGTVIAIRNIARKRKKLALLNTEMDRKNEQNELLLKEIHHRVKNNLEFVKSLIALQSAQLEDSVTKEAMLKSQNRVQSMGLLHQKLYQGNNLGAIEMKDYFKNLSEDILDAYELGDQIKIECAMEQIELDIDTAVPIGLIVNELITNSLKYAFPEGKNGKIQLSLSKKDERTLTLLVADNGVGKNEEIESKGTGFGSQLVSLLTQQLNGSCEEKTEQGHTTQFEFKLNTAA